MSVWLTTYSSTFVLVTVLSLDACVFCQSSFNHLFHRMLGFSPTLSNFFYNIHTPFLWFGDYRAMKLWAWTSLEIQYFGTRAYTAKTSMYIRDLHSIPYRHIIIFLRVKTSFSYTLLDHPKTQYPSETAKYDINKLIFILSTVFHFRSYQVYFFSPICKNGDEYLRRPAELHVLYARGTLRLALLWWASPCCSLLLLILYSVYGRVVPFLPVGTMYLGIPLKNQAPDLFQSWNFERHNGTYKHGFVFFYCNLCYL